EGKKELVPIADGQKVPEGATAKTETKTDYCGYITMVSEAATTAYTALQNQKTEQNFQGSKPEARQAASFYAIADSHKTMAKSAKVQYQVWTGTAACYTAYALQATYQGDWKVYAKLAASVFIASYYKKKEKAHKEREKILNQMAQELPQAGECNPFTNRSCFCAEESSLTADPANYQKFCTPQALANRNATGDAFVCVDANKNIDAQCKCASSNNCIDKRLKIAGINLGLNPTVLKDPLATLKPISSGFGSAGLNAAAARNLALATKTLKSFKPKKPVSLNNAQKEIAKSLFKNGIPKSSAAYLSKVKTTPKASSLVKSSGFSGGRLNSRSAKTKRIASKKGKFQIGSSGARKSNRRSGNPFSRYKKKSKRASNSPYIEDFAKKAERKAEITNDHSKRIFDIISYRYKMSTWKDFLPKSTE
ncbi:MAG: hypothetical protein HON90_04835, partial [Halobacteriovoraceae bacterium]|nr:hypothetical protein [Halobacteriovoraceae bacterium]